MKHYTSYEVVESCTIVGSGLVLTVILVYWSGVSQWLEQTPFSGR